MERNLPMVPDELVNDARRLKALVDEEIESGDQDHRTWELSR